MEAKDLNLEEVLKRRQQWVVPVYQRQYSWDRDLVEGFFADIERLAREYLDTGELSPHFFGAVIYESVKGAGFGAMLRHMVVDGQQRLSTFHLMSAAIMDVARARGHARIVEVLSSYVFNAQEAAMEDAGRDMHKLWSALPDRPVYLTLATEGLAGLQRDFPGAFKPGGAVYLGDVEGRNVPTMLRAFAILRERLDALLDDSDAAEADVLNAVLSGFLHAATVVLIELGKEDDARAIFASLNGRAKPLSDFDLIRNDIFQRAIANGESEEALYYGDWQRLEGDWWQASVRQGRLTRARVDHFFAHMLVALTRNEVKAGRIAKVYQDYIANAEPCSVADEVAQMLGYAAVYRRLDAPSPGDPEARIARFLRVWDMSVMHPLVLQIGRSELGDDDKRALYRRLEDYILRRDIAGLTRKNLNSAVPSILRAFAQDGISVDTFNAWVAGAKGDGSRMPSASEIEAGCVEADAYHNLKQPKLRYIFHRLEHHIRSKYQETVRFETDDLQIEHILPNRWAEHWPLADDLQALDEDWSAHIAQGGTATPEQIESFTVRERRKNTLGNLTLLTPAVNPEISNKGWSVKSGPDGYRKSILRLNAELVDSPEWTEAKIEARGRELAAYVAELWRA